MTWQQLRSWAQGAIWLIPAALITVAGGLALGLIQLDEIIGRTLPITFSGGPDSARALLGAIAASMLTLTVLVFSITVVVLQLTSSQFSPRVLRTFLHDRKTQFSLGVFAGTFVYALLALRSVRGQDVSAGSFVPDVTVSVGVILVLLSVGVFIAYIQNITQSIRVVTIIDRITAETEASIERQADRGDADDPAPEVTVPATPILAVRRGVVTSIDTERLVRLATACEGWVRSHHHIGTYVPAGATVASVHGHDGEPDVDELAGGFVYSTERTMEEDPAFGFRQLVDIAERALSPGVNDPSTAVQCLDAMHHLLRVLAAAPPTTLTFRDKQGRSA